MNEIKWITKNGVHIPITNKYMNDKIRKDAHKKKKQDKIDYEKYIEARKNSVDAFIATNGEVQVLSEDMANELVKLGMEEELLPYAYPLKDNYPIALQMENDSGWLDKYRESALRTKQQDDEYQIEKQKWELEEQRHKEVDDMLNKLNKTYTGGVKDFKDYENDSYNIDFGFDVLNEDEAVAVEDYTDENARYNYRYFNNILNGHWKDRELDGEGIRRMNLIDNAINKSTINDNIYLYRATNKTHITKDAILFNKGYSSTSIYKDAIENVNDNSDILRIRVPKGTKGLYIGGNTMSLLAEYEVLLGRNTKMQVLGKNSDGTIECIIVGE